MTDDRDLDDVDESLLPDTGKATKYGAAAMTILLVVMLAMIGAGWSMGGNLELEDDQPATTPTPDEPPPTATPQPTPDEPTDAPPSTPDGPTDATATPASWGSDYSGSDGGGGGGSSAPDAPPAGSQEFVGNASAG